MLLSYCKIRLEGRIPGPHDWSGYLYEAVCGWSLSTVRQYVGGTYLLSDYLADIDKQQIWSTVNHFTGIFSTANQIRNMS